MKNIEKQKSVADIRVTKKEPTTFGDSKYQQSSMMNNPMMYSKIARLQENGQNFFQLKEAEKEKLEKLNEEIRIATAMLDEKRKDVMDKKRSPNDDNPIRLEKKMKAMHLKIDNIRNKYNFADSANRGLREEINKFRREINLYKQIQIILKKKIGGAQKMVVEQAENTKQKDKKFEEGTKSLYRKQSEYAIKKKRQDKEYQSVFQVLGEENRDQRKREKFGDKAADGSVMKSQSPWSKSGSDFYKSQQGFQESGQYGSQKKIHPKHEKKVEGGSHLEQLKSEVEYHDEIFQKLVESCLPGTVVDLKGEDRKKRNQIEQELLKKIITTFQDYDEQKNAIYQYIGSLREESEQLEKQKKDIEDEINKFLQLPEMIKKDPKVQKCFEIERQIEGVRRKKAKQDIEHKRLMLYINQLKMQIPVVFEKIGCDSEEYTRELGDHQGKFNFKDIDESNIIQYLGILEKRTNDLLQLQNQAFNNGKQTQYSDQRKQRVPEESNLSLSNFGGKAKDEDLQGMLDNFKLKNEDSEKDKFMFMAADFQDYAENVYNGLKNKKKKDKK